MEEDVGRRLKNKRIEAKRIIEYLGNHSYSFWGVCEITILLSDRKYRRCLLEQEADIVLLDSFFLTVPFLSFPSCFSPTLLFPLIF